MKLRRDTTTGIVGLIGCAFFAVYIQFIKMPAKLLEPGPRLLPYVSIVLIAMSAVALIVKGVKEHKIEEKPYFPKGGILKITKSFLMLVVYAIAMTYLGFVITTPFATYAFIYDLKGNSEIKPIVAIIISILVTACLYAMFVYGFQIKLPAGVLFD
ncbi:tripartite tricarboxylate transporter TctB family protein [Anaerobium acetethylicum]|uniref:Tripartite tricarboxylate transporter TctB family protein n=1 Tax=Anaerobium acetethylicum TaxID=1619234 RepID=A0A1D3TX43_9FIRM|nr:tripartite tricarboxylate transporter TctB family protein [Anaerobium acetethylicum]SCP98892.1 Tripartite tricarboxylate transporter TctB family protein [Anaerobium acetethylicum]